MRVAMVDPTYLDILLVHNTRHCIVVCGSVNAGAGTEGYKGASQASQI